ncbi:MAG: tRNA uridine-5-carboxymethylaminomethyl(34) synthesis GTPase MnmE [Candidatus Brocadia sp.]|nr:tRNA uridine-5-carboxymethylaminomethyl(34) synthesis GTPase MnmE [Candidatus Brocadia sp.]
MCSEIQDTIVAVSTPSGRSLHAIIKISGQEAIHCIKDFFVSASHIDLEITPSYSSVQGHLSIPGEYITIPVVLYVMRKPYSYTKEDVVEIHTIGSPPLLDMLLDALLSRGIQTKRSIRLSQPGEFTKRAFLHGRIDLTQAEATMRIIRAQTDLELKAAIAHLTGDVSREIRRIQDDAISLCAHIEAAIDFSDQDIELIPATEIMNRLEAITTNISHFLNQPETTKVLTEGIDTVLYGKPNVGKSSLINALLGKRRALVSDVPGTTRDVVTDILEIGGIRYKLADTAGVDDTKGTIISRAMEKAQSLLKRAQILLLVFDGSTNLSGQFLEMKSDDLTNNVIIIINKCDLPQKIPYYELPEEFKEYPIVHTSTLTGEGLERLKELLLETVMGGRINSSVAPPMLNARQREALQRCLQSVQQAMESARNNESYEFVALDLRTAIDTLGEIVGKATTEDILDNIFSGFCIGK